MHTGHVTTKLGQRLGPRGSIIAQLLASIVSYKIENCSVCVCVSTLVCGCVCLSPRPLAVAAGMVRYLGQSRKTGRVLVPVVAVRVCPPCVVPVIVQVACTAFVLFSIGVEMSDRITSQAIQSLGPSRCFSSNLCHKAEPSLTPVPKCWDYRPETPRPACHPCLSFCRCRDHVSPKGFL